MTENNAREMGFEFTGVYNRDREESRKRAEEIKKQGYKCHLVSVKDNPHSRNYRGGVVGYSVFAEKKYFEDRAKEDLKRKLSAIEARKQNAYEQYLKEIAKIEEEAVDLQNRLDELNK